MGQSLCFYNNNNRQRKASEVYSNGNGVHSAASGVSKLPESVRVDLANKLFDIRKTFQHTWLSRNLASTLPNALKIFDNLFRALLPPSMQEYERIL
ncbi:Protein T16G1.9 [Aphelenchoides avenae]|nr:Protein T16G1.9 [Aphelenchus avenae]